MNVRPLTENDLQNGFIETLAALKPIDQPIEKIKEIFRKRNESGNINTYVLEENGRIIATGTVIIEPKFYGTVSHIEDVAVHPDQQGRGLGRVIMEALKCDAVANECYKSILDCSNKNIPFYEKMGYRTHETQMRIDHH
jgi:glucosamine-phosphate N-acetyltransferase